MTTPNGTAPPGTTEPTRIGLASLAHVHAAGYAALLASRPDVQWALADPDAASATDPDASRRAQQLAERYGVTLFDSYAELFDFSDGVIVCAETSRHRALVERAAAAGVAVLCEKPLATTVTDAQAMLRACTAAGVPLFTAYPVRLHPDFADLREKVRAGRLGRVLSASGTNNGRAPFGQRAWFADPALAGGGALVDHTVHLADLLDVLFDAPAVRVYAQTNGILHGDRPSVRAGAIETGGLVVIHYADGGVATIDCSWSAPASYPAWGGLTLTLHGEWASATFDAFSHRLECFEDHTGTVSWPDYGVGLDALLLQQFVQVVRTGTIDGGTIGLADGAAGLRGVAIVEAAYRSAASGQPEGITAVTESPAVTE